MRQELLELLRLYLQRRLTIRECAKWLAGVDWDDPGLNEADRQTIATLRLIQIEVSEGMRPESEFREAAAGEMQAENPTLYITGASTTGGMQMYNRSGNDILVAPFEVTVGSLTSPARASGPDVVLKYTGGSVIVEVKDFRLRPAKKPGSWNRPPQLVAGSSAHR